MSDPGVAPQGISNEALLALVVDDEDALLTLAAWGAIAPRLEQLGDAETAGCVIGSIEVIAGINSARVCTALAKLRAARVLVDGGITPLADKLLQQRVKQRLMPGRSR